MTVDFLELKKRRSRSIKHYRTREGRYFAEYFSGTVLSWQDDRGNWQNVDISLRPVEDGDFDGWQMVDAEYFYRVGSRAGVDGWVGFGGRRGASWFNFRLDGLCFWHMPTQTITPIDRAITYDRERLTHKGKTLAVGKGTDWINVASNVTWAGVLDGVDITWRVEGSGVKEDIKLDRSRLETLPRAATGDFDTLLGFMIEIDGDVEIKYKGITHRLNDEFEPGIDRFDLIDKQGLLAFMPFDYVKSTGRPGTFAQQQSQISVDDDPTVPIYKKFTHIDGKNYLIIGAFLNDLYTLPRGDLIFDPSITLQPDDSTGKDTWHEKLRATSIMGGGNGLHVNSCDYDSTTCAAGYGRRNAFIAFDLTSIPSGSLCTKAQLTLTNYYNGAGGANIKAHPMLFDWSEDYLNWYYYDNGKSWPGRPGSRDPGVDYSTEVIAEFKGPTVNYGKVTANFDTQYFTDRFGSSPAKPNYGWTHRAYDGFNNFYSSGSGDPDRRPKLYLEYTEVISEPSAAIYRTSSDIGAAEHLTSFGVGSIKVIDLPPIPINAEGNLFWQTTSDQIAVIPLITSGSTQWVAVTSGGTPLTYGLYIERQAGYLIPK